MKNHPEYKLTNKAIWSGRIDPSNSDDPLYYHQKVIIVDPSMTIGFDDKNEVYALIGYASDIGAVRNQGRSGAKDGPDTIRKSLAKLAWHGGAQKIIMDMGNLLGEDDKMEETQKGLSALVHNCLDNHFLPIVLGGSHDLAFGHYEGIYKFLKNADKKGTLGIINIDAHFDLRKPIKKGNSGTPFYQISQSYLNNDSEFKYMCVGINNASNNTDLFATANELNTIFISNTDCYRSNWTEIKLQINAFIEEVDYVYLSIDLDAFSSSVSPGVSAPNPIGLSPHFVFKCLDEIINSKKLISLDIAEMNPKYDIDGRTALLASEIINYLVVNC